MVAASAVAATAPAAAVVNSTDELERDCVRIVSTERYSAEATVVVVVGLTKQVPIMCRSRLRSCVMWNKLAISTCQLRWLWALSLLYTMDIDWDDTASPAWATISSAWVSITCEIVSPRVIAGGVASACSVLLVSTRAAAAFLLVVRSLRSA